ncbi:uncharacterized protein LOC135463914 [Liolophura sinensis]|uniref:uncharacterized protein LOC135463914 n=1 Tax=Liolophura sinensis TaxID=3198878 RepID=UPI003158C594
MAADSGQSTDATAQNPWYFSPCSVSDFRKQIKTLDIEANNCLLTQSPDLDPTALTPLLQIPPGQKYGVDTQCAYFLGNGSTFCRSLYSEASYPELCGGMFCSIPGTDRCGKTVPARGTSCGPNKWCESGACVYSAEAPDVQASCPFGEYTGIIGEVDMTCAEVIQFLRVACYREDFSQRCCESCPSIQSGIPNCQYGDWAEDCSISDCANPDSLEVCCKTCYEANATQPTTTANVPSRTTAPKTTEAIPSTAIKTPPTTITVSKSPTTVLSTTTYNPTATTAAPTATASITRSATTMSTATESATQPATTVPSTTTTDEVNPDTFPWGEWAGIIAGMLVLLVLAPALACCLVKCRRQPKDPMDTISNKGDVEITKFNRPPVYMNRTHQPGYGWTGNQTSQQTQPDEGNEAEHGFAPANKKTKSITTEKDGETSWIVNNAFLGDD